MLSVQLPSQDVERKTPESVEIELQTVEKPAMEKGDPFSAISLVCPNGDRLTPFRVGNKSQFRCARCPLVFGMGAVLFGCAVCDFNVCVGCLVQKSSSHQPEVHPVPKNANLCPRQHPITPAMTRNLFLCNVCFSTVSGVVFGCRQCNYDVCVPCMARQVLSSSLQSINFVARPNQK